MQLDPIAAFVGGPQHLPAPAPDAGIPSPPVLVDHDGVSIDAPCMSRVCFPDNPNHVHHSWPSAPATATDTP